MMACIILHNMIIENERDDGLPPIDYERSDASPTERGLKFAEYCEGFRQVRNESRFFSLRNDLIKHHCVAPLASASSLIHSSQWRKLHGSL